MLDIPHVTTTDAQLTAVIPLTIPRADIQHVMGPGIQEIMGALQAQGITPAGPWLTYHRRLDPSVFDFEIAVPVTTPVSPVGRVRPGSLPAATVARAVVRGSYEQLPAAWPKLDAWIAEQGDRPRGDFWERYVRGPESSSDPTTWETELNRVLA